ncbi:MAG: SAM-dependent methyltransferase [Polyangiaceae bacterium]|jgi:SAM-dependent methyltransferase|nr:SAM-dependent methyltransferase [Polyangiaceae bacterium]
MSVAEHLARVRDVALPVCDVLAERVDGARTPAWCEARGWSPFLLTLTDQEVREAEAHGLATAMPERAPESLQSLARDVARVTSLPGVTGTTPLDDEALRNVRLRKRAQLSRLLAAVGPMAEVAERIVDVGAGSGHFTRLSAELFQREAVGLEQSAERVASAKQRSQVRLASFVAVDALDELSLTPADLAIGLHACGALGDHLARAAARARCGLALVSCCLQKIATDVRSPLAGGIELRREHLGLANLTSQPRGVEASIEVTIGARQTRYALGQLLRARGVELEPGAEMSGINRRQANAGLAVVAVRALSLRQLAPPTDAELAHHEALAARDYAIIRRLSLPRSMLSRLVEVLVSLDRGALLEGSGLSVRVATLFDRSVSPRNIGIFAHQDRRRLPAA